jgi:hypothetical protein
MDEIEYFNYNYTGHKSGLMVHIKIKIIKEAKNYYKRIDIFSNFWLNWHEMSQRLPDR